MIAAGRLIDIPVHIDGTLPERSVYLLPVYHLKFELIDAVDRRHKPSENGHSLSSFYLPSFRTKEEEKRRNRGEVPEVLHPMIDKTRLVDGEGAE